MPIENVCISNLIRIFVPSVMIIKPKSIVLRNKNKEENGYNERNLLGKSIGEFSAVYL